MSSAKRFLLPLLILPPLLAAWWGWPRHAPDAPEPRPAAAAAVLRVTFLDVGQGDACVIEGPPTGRRRTRRVVVVDGGGHPDTDERDGNSDPGARVVVPFLRHRVINDVDMIVATHPHDDHVQGLIAVTERLRVRQALDAGYPGKVSPIYRRLRERLRRRGIPVRTARRGQRIDLGGEARLEVLGPPGRVLGGRSPENNHSIVLRLVYGRARFLLAGDAEAEAEADLLASKQRLSADLLKVGHHGSRWSSTEPFLDRVAPGLAVISCGKDNLFNHPHPQVLERLARRGVRVFRTDRHGALTVETDGARIRVTPTVAAAPRLR